jgi:O-antigen/teichoic acid export membrane protein
MSEDSVSAPSAISNKDVAKGAGTTLLARLGAVLEVIAQPLYVWMFGLAGFGLYAVLWSAINLAENCLDMGMTGSLQRVVPQAKSREDEAKAVRAAFVLGVGPCLIAAALVSLFAPYIAPLFNAAADDAARLVHIIALFAWALPLWAFIEIATSALRAKRVFGAEIRLRLFWEQVARLLIAVTLYFGGFETMSLFYAHLASLALICILCVRLLARYFDLGLVLRGPLRGPMFAETLKAGLAVLPVNLVGRLFGDGPPLILNWILPGAQGAAAGGLYAISRKVSSIVQLVRIAFSYVLAPLASAAKHGANGEVRNIYAFATRLSYAIAVPAGVVLASGGPAILRLFGPEAAIALPALVILVLMRSVEAVVGSAGPIQQVIGGYKSQLIGSVAGLAAAFLLGLILMPEWGLTGMALSVALGVTISTGLPLVQLHYYEKLHPFEAPFGRVMVRSSLVAVAGLLTAISINWMPLGVQLPLVVALMLASIWLSARLALPIEDRQTLGKTGRALRLA